MRRLTKYVIFFVGVLLILLTGFQQAFAATYWEPRHTLKNDLNVYETHNSSSPKICRVPAGNAIKQLIVSDRWIQIEYKECTGWVSKSSVVKFNDDNGYLLNKIFNEITYFASGDIFYILAADMCFVIPKDMVRDIAIGYSNKITIQEYLNSVGGLRPRTSEELKICSGG